MLHVPMIPVVTQLTLRDCKWIVVFFVRTCKTNATN